VDISIIVLYFVRVSFIANFTLIVSSYFYLRNLENRFETLNDLWKSLPEGLLAVTGECSQYDIAMMVDNIRTLHAVLSDILRIFSRGYGQMLLAYFVLTYIDMMCNFFYLLCYKFSTPASEGHQTFQNIIKEILPLILSLQHIICIMSIITAASRVNDEVKTIQILEYLITFQIIEKKQTKN